MKKVLLLIFTLPLFLLVAVLTAIREDINKTKFRLFTTPLTPVERILGYVLALSFFAMLETGMVVGIGRTCRFRGPERQLDPAG